MRFEITDEFLNTLRKAISENDEPHVKAILHELYPADIAEILNEFNIEEAKYLYKHLGEEIATDVLLELEDDVREKFLASLSSKEIAEQFINNMESDDAADVLGELSEKKQHEVLSHIEDSEQASDIVDLLNYDEDTAGGLMAKELIRVHVNKNGLECVREMREQAENVETVYTIYVVDDDDKLLGTLSLKRLLLSPVRTQIKDIYNPEVISVKTSTHSEDVASIMEKYNLVVLPVVDGIGRLVGRITIDDVVDVMREEADKDIQMMAGFTETVEHTDRVMVITRARIPWLLVGLLGGIIGSRVIGQYEGQIQIHPEMAFFMPLIAAMGGNVGVQSSSIVVQSLATGSISKDMMAKKLLKELSVGLINAAILSTIILAYNLFASDSLSLSLTVSLALFTVILFASLFGAFVPMILKRYDIDPALATGPFITTTNDILGLFLYFYIGRLMYGFA